MDRITELEREIAQKQAELKVLKEQKHLSFVKYAEIGGDFHRTSAISKIRELVLYVLASRKNVRTDRSYYIDTRYVKKARELNVEETKIANQFIDELYPIIKKYVNIAIENQEV